MNTFVATILKNASCPHCKAEDLEVVEYSDTVDFRNLELDVENLQKTKCKNCGHIWTTSEQRILNNSIMREAYAIARDNLRKKHGLLSGDEITQLRTGFSLNQREAAVLFGGGYNAFNKYESGEVLQSFAMDRLLRLSSVVGTPAIDFLKDVFSPPSFVVISTINPAYITINVSERNTNVLGVFSGTSTTSGSSTPLLVDQGAVRLGSLQVPLGDKLTTPKVGYTQRKNED